MFLFLLDKYCRAFFFFLLLHLLLQIFAQSVLSDVIETLSRSIARGCPSCEKHVGVILSDDIHRASAVISAPSGTLLFWPQLPVGLRRHVWCGIVRRYTPSECGYIIVPIRYGHNSLGGYGAMYGVYTGTVLWYFRISSAVRRYFSLRR